MGLTLPKLVLTLLAAIAWPQAQQAAPPAPQSVMLPMRDGVKLATDIYLPGGEGPFPAVVARTPYNKDMGKGIAQQFTSRGYALIVQDSRGRFKSEGKNLAYETDGWADGNQDGYDTIEWVAAQSWSNRKVGTWGGSALGIAQYLLAGTGPPHLFAQHVVVGAPSFYRDIVFRQGVFKKNLIEEWLKSQKFDESQLFTWLDHQAEDLYWLDRDLSTRWRRVNTPAVHVGGWFDIFTQGTIDAYTGYQTRGGTKAQGYQRLIMGPWTHGVNQRKAGQITFPENATAPPNGFGDQWRWYDHWLKDALNGVDKEPAVAYYVMGDTTDPKSPGNAWRFASSWPPPSTPTPWYFIEDKTLSLTPPDTEKEIPPLGYEFDPRDPAPTVGGNHLTLPAGPMDQREVEKRGDVIVFTGPVLDKPLEVTGRVKVKLWFSSNAPDTDFTAKLCDVYPDGRSMNVCDGIIRARYRKTLRRGTPVIRGEIYPLEIDLWSTSMIFNKGHRLRMQISSSNYPAYDINPNTGADLRENGDFRIARNLIYVDGKHPSQIILPVISEP